MHGLPCRFWFWWGVLLLVWAASVSFEALGPPVEPPFAVPPAVATALMTGFEDFKSLSKMLLLDDDDDDDDDHGFSSSSISSSPS